MGLVNEVWGRSSVTGTVSKDAEGHLTAGVCGSGGESQETKGTEVPPACLHEVMLDLCCSHQYTGACCRDTGAALGTDSSSAAAMYGLVWLLSTSVVRREWDS